MGSLFFAIGVAIVTFGAGCLGLVLRARLPDKHSPDKSTGMIGAMTGLLSLVLALVLGTFAGSAYTLYSTQKAELELLGARTMQLDSALEAYGPDARPGREGLRKALRQSYEEIWGDAAGSSKPDAGVRGVLDGTKELDRFLMSLAPKTDTQKQAIFAANGAAADINKTRLLMTLQISGGIPWPMLTIVICWALLMFCGYGLVSTVNGTVITALGLGAITIASAVFLIIELSDPYSGTFKLSATPVRETMEALGPMTP